MYPKIDRATLNDLLAAKKKVLKGVDLTDIDAQSPPIDFSGVTIESCTLSNMNLTGLTFRKATVKHCWVNGTDFSGADFSDAKLIGSFVTKMDRAKFDRATLKKTDFMRASLTGASFRDADLEKAFLLSAMLDGATFAGAKLSGADFGEASLVGTDFTKAILDGAKLQKADVSRAVGLAGAGSKGAASKASTVYDTAGAEGGPIVVVPAALAPKWNANGQADLDRATDAAEDVITVGGWVETASVPFEGARALVLVGELDTGFIATEDGGVFIRGGSFDDDLSEGKKAVAKASKKKGWKPHAHPFVLQQPDAFVFSGIAKGAANAPDIATDFGVVHAKLPAGTYAVDVLGIDGDEGPVVFIRLRR